MCPIIKVNNAQVGKSSTSNIAEQSIDREFEDPKVEAPRISLLSCSSGHYHARTIKTQQLFMIA